MWLWKSRDKISLEFSWTRSLINLQSKASRGCYLRDIKGHLPLCSLGNYVVLKVELYHITFLSGIFYLEWVLSTFVPSMFYLFVLYDFQHSLYLNHYCCFCVYSVTGKSAVHSLERPVIYTASLQSGSIVAVDSWGTVRILETGHHALQR